MTTQAGKKVAAKKEAINTKMAQARVDKAVREKSSPKKVTSAAAWKQTQGTPLEVPSGNVALVRPVGMQAFLQKGIIPNSLREIATEAITKKKAPEIKLEDLREDQIADMISLFDSVTCYCVIDPVVHPVPMYVDEEGNEHPVPPADRDPSDVLYVDEVDMNDKMAVFAFACGGTRDLESFREELAGGVERLLGEQNLAD